MKRRSFLKGVGAALAGLGLAKGVEAEEPAKPVKRQTNLEALVEEVRQRSEPASRSFSVRHEDGEIEFGPVEFTVERQNVSGMVKVEASTFTDATEHCFQYRPHFNWPENYHSFYENVDGEKIIVSPQIYESMSKLLKDDD